MTKKNQYNECQLIITRPENQAKNLLSQLQLATNNQQSIIHLPLIRIEPIPLVTSDFTVNSLNGVIFISGHAAQYFFANISLPKITIISVGDSTASQVKQLSGQSVIYPTQMNAEGVVELPQLQSVNGQHWLIVKGVNGRQYIQRALKSRGATVTELDVYQRKLPTMDVQHKVIRAQSSQSIWIISSTQALENLYRILGLANKPEHQTKIIVSSLRLDKQARQKGFIIIAVSMGASETQLVQCVQSLI